MSNAWAKEKVASVPIKKDVWAVFRNYIKYLSNPLGEMPNGIKKGSQEITNCYMIAFLLKDYVKKNDAVFYEKYKDELNRLIRREANGNRRRGK